MFSPGQTLGNYQLQNLLGRGGMGAVYQALDLRLQRTVAIKVMQPEVAENAELRQRFLQEARAAAALSHPNIVHVFEFHADGSQLYLVMELVQGGSLRDYFNRMEAQSYVMHLDEVLYIIEQASTGLYHAHMQGMIHRDIKPDNALLKANPIPGGMPYTVVLTDFGLAKLVDAQNLVKTQLNHPLGTLPYMAPEQFQGRADARSDIYAMGIMFYELLAARLPFLPRSMAEAASMHMNQPPPSLRQYRSDLPPHVEAVVMKALAKSPDERYQTVAELAQALSMNSSSGSGIPSQGSAPQQVPVAAGPVIPMVADLEKPKGVLVAANESFNEDTIILVKAGQIYQRIPVRKNMMMMGRDPNHDIALPGDKVSRNHARLDRRPDGTYIITDLGSSNGSFLAGAKLVKDVAEAWPPEQELIIGEFGLQLYKANSSSGEVNKTQVANFSPSAGGGYQPQQPAAQQPPRPAGGGGYAGGTQVFDFSDVSAPAQPGAYQPPVQQQQQPAQNSNIIRVNLEPEQVIVEAGGVANATVNIYNTSTIVKHCRLRLYGLDQEWYTIPPATLQLLPDEGGNLSIVLKPPREATSTAGQHIFDIRVLDERMEPIGYGQGILIVKPYYEFSIELEPEIIRRRGLVWLTIANEGNARDSYIVRGKDKEDGLRFFHDQRPVIIDPLTKVSVELEVRPKSRVLIGGAKMYQYELEATTASNLERTANGQLISPPVFPIWILPLFMLLCLCLLLLLLLLGTGVIEPPGPDDTPTAEATPTETIIPTVDSAPVLDLLTATAQQFDTDIVPDVTATQEFLLTSDLDDDGLTYAQELELGTDPDLADTDGDGLTDGDEVNEHQSNPLLRDTDGDDLNDFDEINEHGTDPNLADTDDDDLDDFIEITQTYGAEGEEPRKTNPTRADTDSDGITDGIEVQFGFDPTDPRSLPESFSATD